MADLVTGGLETMLKYHSRANWTEASPKFRIAVVLVAFDVRNSFCGQFDDGGWRGRGAGS